MIKGGGGKKSKIRISLKAFFLLPVILLAFVLSVRIQSFGGDGGAAPHAVGMTSDTPDDNAPSDHSRITLPQCAGSPWKENENLVGSCPGGAMKPHALEQTHGTDQSSLIQQCAEDCCTSDDCITWQYRRDTGCLHGGDVRLGQEKDGVSAWCSDHPPQRWQGQYVLKRGGGKILADREATGACSLDTWNPNEQPGQCFGLGDVKTIGSESAQSCMEACCEKEDCGAWQYQQNLGCFYHKRMHGCVDASDPVVFEAFVGRRKIRSARTYTDKRGKPWSMTLN